MQQKLHHIARALRAVGGSAVPQLIVGDRDRPRGAGHRLHSDILGALSIVLAAGQHSGRPHALRSILRIVEQQHLAGAMIALTAAILVQSLRRAARLVGVAVAMIVEQVARPENAGQGAMHRRIGEHLRQLWNPRQQVVAGVRLGAEQFVGPAADRSVELIGQCGVQRHVAGADELPHLPVRQQLSVLVVGGHFGTPPRAILPLIGKSATRTDVRVALCGF